MEIITTKQVRFRNLLSSLYTMHTHMQETIQHGGKTFELLCANYGNVIFVLISDTQLQKIGTLVSLHYTYTHINISSKATREKRRDRTRFRFNLFNSHLIRK